jgi:hypothetical protein
MEHHNFKSYIEVPARLVPYAPVYLRNGRIAQLARFVGKYIKRGWIARRLFDLGYEQMKPEPASEIFGVAIEDSVEGSDGFHYVKILVGGDRAGD